MALSVWRQHPCVRRPAAVSYACIPSLASILLNFDRKDDGFMQQPWAIDANCVAGKINLTIPFNEILGLWVHTGAQKRGNR
jgi:hypothetical protein